MRLDDPIQRRFAPLIALLVIIWCVAIVNLALGQALAQYGIVPRSVAGLVGVAFAPFLHAGLAHTAANTLPLLVLGGLLLASNRADFWSVTLTGIIGGGLLTWALARGGTVHVGASGLLFAYFGYLVARGIFERSLGAMSVSLLVVVLYGGMVWGVLPGRPFISFESHLFGFVAGVATAWFGRRRSRDAAA